MYFLYIKLEKLTENLLIIPHVNCYGNPISFTGNSWNNAHAQAGSRTQTSAFDRPPSLPRTIPSKYHKQPQLASNI